MTDGVQVIWTPWRARDELLELREYFFPASPSDELEDSKLRRKACDQVISPSTTNITLDIDSPQISAWKLRGNLPHAVESTWLLTEATLTDEIQANRVPLFAVKAAYITAISRYAREGLIVTIARACHLTRTALSQVSWIRNKTANSKCPCTLRHSKLAYLQC